MRDNPPQDRGRRPLIILAEDNLVWRHLLATALELDGMAVIQMGASEALLVAALAARASEPGAMPDLIITDVGMPTGGGLTTARSIRDVDPAMPIIFTTAFSDTWTRREAARCGAVLLEKPVELSAVKRAVRDALAGAGRQDPGTRADPARR